MALQVFLLVLVFQASDDKSPVVDPGSKKEKPAYEWPNHPFPPEHPMPGPFRDGDPKESCEDMRQKFIEQVQTCLGNDPYHPTGIVCLNPDAGGSQEQYDRDLERRIQACKACSSRNIDPYNECRQENSPCLPQYPGQLRLCIGPKVPKEFKDLWDLINLVTGQGFGSGACRAQLDMLRSVRRCGTTFPTPIREYY